MTEKSPFLHLLKTCRILVEDLLNTPILLVKLVGDLFCFATSFGVCNFALEFTKKRISDATLGGGSA